MLIGVKNEKLLKYTSAIFILSGKIGKNFSINSTFKKKAHKIAQIHLMFL